MAGTRESKRENNQYGEFLDLIESLENGIKETKSYYAFGSRGDFLLCELWITWLGDESLDLKSRTAVVKTT